MIGGEGGEVVAGRSANGAHDAEGHPKVGPPAIQSTRGDGSGDARDKLRGGVGDVGDYEPPAKAGGGGVDMARKRPMEGGEVHDQGHGEAEAGGSFVVVDVDDLSPGITSMIHGVHKDANAGVIPRESAQEELVPLEALVMLFEPVAGGVAA